ncbi:MAG: hypothetical protein LUQ29_12160 [Methylococcaceae bacterium]|jgi:hypothetical protein|nr:hypothetical protein [Methylococcaceae bacterium]
MNASSHVRNVPKAAGKWRVLSTKRKESSYCHLSKTLIIVHGGNYCANGVWRGGRVADCCGRRAAQSDVNSHGIP